jgi:putative membrane protein
MDLASYYPWLRAFHIIAVIAWMAGLLYLPRLFVYQCQATPGSPEYERFTLMEQRLLTRIMAPSMAAAWILGITLAVTIGAWDDGWFHGKLLAVILMSGAHGFFARCHKDFARGANRRTERFYRIVNEIPAILMVIIVILAVVKPF